ncbi:MAG TPA: site-2 protease family protein [Amycolatopsis sp.]|uniref:M50 family metallopeptidase n=1 Tax=Amycolatopsis sp. TaxID=37632 RepID=UPI002B4A8162|nr:site-2 protease family protein [Amycolatopsis sp.]HKS47982.1 site-2 protease family protein [Amycolatopsis sp.]
MLAYALGVVLFVLGICGSVALHEAGHLLTAKAFGMRVRRYFVGFGPKVFSVRRGETEYGLKWLPFGGFCEIAGMTTLDEVTPDEAPRAMWRFKAWKRTTVLAAGPATNFVLGFAVLFAMALTTGLPNLAGTPEVTAVTSDAPAQQAGVRAGDEIVAVGGQATATYTDVITRVRQASGPTSVDVLRNGQRMSLTVAVRNGAIGVTFPRTFTYTAGTALGGAAKFTGQMFTQTWQRLLEFPQRVPAVIHSIFGGERDPNTPISVVGMSRIGGEAVQQGLWVLFLLLLASFNFFIGVFNLLPLLPLDGGHIAVIWYERVRDGIRKLLGKAAAGPVDYSKLAGVTMALVFVGGAVTLLTIAADLVNPVRLG